MIMNQKNDTISQDEQIDLMLESLNSIDSDKPVELDERAVEVTLACFDSDDDEIYHQLKNKLLKI